MIEQPPKEDILHIFKEIESNPQTTQRAISCNTGISLGKINYLLKAFIKKGLVKVKDFSDNPGKLKKISYSLTKKGIAQRIQLLKLYLKIKEDEYNRIKLELGKVSRI